MHDKERGIIINLESTSNDGLVSFEKIKDGDYLLKASLDGYSDRTSEEIVQFSQTGAKKKTTLRLQRLPHLEIKVIDDQGYKVPGVEVTLYEQEEFNTPGEHPLSVGYTDVQGTVDFLEMISNKEYIIVVKKKGYNADSFEKILTTSDQFQQVVLLPE